MLARIFWSSLFSLLLSANAAAQKVELASNEHLAEQWVASRVLAEIYHRAGIALSINAMPPSRANIETIAGHTGGEVARIRSYGDFNPTLIRVEPAYYYLTSVAFSATSRNAMVRTRDDLVHYSVGVIRGVAHSRDLTENHPATTLVQNAEVMFRMLAAGRFDVAIDTGINGRYMVRKLGLNSLKVSPDLARRELYHYLHPSQRHYVDKISAQIRALAASGELDKLIAKAEREMFEANLEDFSGLQR